MTSMEIHPADDVGFDRPSRTRRKSVLFCPACGHESEVDGDWDVDRDGETATTRCPDCRTVISDR